MSGAGGMLQPGAEIVGTARTITDAEIALLPALMGAINPLFHDAETAKSTPMGRRILYGPALLGIAIAGTEPGLRDHVIGLMGIDEIRFRRPVGPGDTVTPICRVTDRIPKPDRPGDVLVVADEVRNQDGELVLSFGRTIMVKRLAA